jgi:hypothetical protein
VDDEGDLCFPRHVANNERTEMAKHYFLTRGFYQGGVIAENKADDPNQGRIFKYIQ